jgi:hypothetical protein
MSYSSLAPISHNQSGIYNYLFNLSFFWSLDFGYKLIPVSLQGAKKPDKLALIHHVEFENDWNTDSDDWQKLITAIQTL